MAAAWRGFYDVKMLIVHPEAEQTWRPEETGFT